MPLLVRAGAAADVESMSGSVADMAVILARPMEAEKRTNSLALAKLLVNV